jgi:hypothetical protein
LNLLFLNDVKEKLEEIGCECPYAEVSAETGENVEEGAFNPMISLIQDKL